MEKKNNNKLIIDEFKQIVTNLRLLKLAPVDSFLSMIMYIQKHT